MLLDHLELMLMDGGGYALTSFRAASNEMNFVVRSLCLQAAMYYIHFSGYSLSILGCRLITLVRSPGVWPIGVCKVVQCIVAKAALYVIRNDIKLQQDHSNSVWGRLWGQRLLLML